jgi:hypothetical protein
MNIIPRPAGSSRITGRRIMIIRFMLVCSFAVIAGCVSVNKEPFLKYRTAVEEARDGMDAAMSVGCEWTRSEFIEDFSSDPDSKFSDLTIETERGCDYSMPFEPIYLEVKKARFALAELNKAFFTYADLLARLAGDDLLNADIFDQIARDLNENARKALKALGVSAKPKRMALFSAAASEAARLYIEKRRRTYLYQAIMENQKM